MYENLTKCPSLSYFIKPLGEAKQKENERLLNGVSYSLHKFYEDFGWGVVGTKLLDIDGEEEVTQNYLILETIQDLFDVLPDSPNGDKFWVFGHDMAGFYGLIDKVTGMVSEIDIGPLIIHNLNYDFATFLKNRISSDEANYNDFITVDDMRLQKI